MNEYEKGKLREHWQRPGTLRMLLQELPLTPSRPETTKSLKKVSWMTGIAVDLRELAQLYYMLEEDGIIVRDNEPAPAPAIFCPHVRHGDKPCNECQFKWGNNTDFALFRYRLAKDISAY